MKAVINYLKEVRLELTKVVWPKRSEVIKLTVIIIIISGIIAAYTGVLDFLFTKMLSLLISK